jgi:hypothetical protein
MPHLWTTQNDRWQPAPLRGTALALDAGGALRPAAPGDAAPLRFRGTASDAWVLLAAPRAGVRVNGAPLLAGIRVLLDRDEIRFGGARCFFSSERLVQVEPFPGVAGGAFCARCRKAIEPDTAAVRCPGCGTWCHQREDLGCWDFSPQCPLCPQPTALDAGFRWQPEF